MRIGVIGINWGRVHCEILQRLGHPPELILGRNPDKLKRIARDMGIEGYTTDVEDLEPLDVIVLASPPALHFDHISWFRQKWILCEKPLSLDRNQVLGLGGQAPQKCMVNYAFPYLRAAAQCSALLNEVGVDWVDVAKVRVEFGLPGEKSMQDWFFDIATHPVAYLYQQLGGFKVHQVWSDDSVAQVHGAFEGKNCAFDARTSKSDQAGIIIQVALEGYLRGKPHQVLIEGVYRPDLPWVYRFLENGEVVAPRGEGQVETGCPWINANVRSVESFLNLIQGHRSLEQVQNAGSVTAREAFKMEQCLKKD